MYTQKIILLLPEQIPQNTVSFVLIRNIDSDIISKEDRRYLGKWVKDHIGAYSPKTVYCTEEDLNAVGEGRFGNPSRKHIDFSIYEDIKSENVVRLLQ